MTAEVALLQKIQSLLFQCSPQPKKACARSSSTLKGSCLHLKPCPKGEATTISSPARQDATTAKKRGKRRERGRQKFKSEMKFFKGMFVDSLDTEIKSLLTIHIPV